MPSEHRLHGGTVERMVKVNINIMAVVAVENDGVEAGHIRGGNIWRESHWCQNPNWGMHDLRWSNKKTGLAIV